MNFRQLKDFCNNLPESELNNRNIKMNNYYKEAVECAHQYLDDLTIEPNKGIAIN